MASSSAISASIFVKRRLPSYAVLAFNLFGDGLRDILDPRLGEK